MVRCLPSADRNGGECSFNQVGNIIIQSTGSCCILKIYHVSSFVFFIAISHLYVLICSSSLLKLFLP